MELTDEELRVKDKPNYYQGLPESLQEHIKNIEQMDIYGVSFNAVTISGQTTKDSDDTLTLGKRSTKTVLADYHKALNLTLLISLRQYFYKGNHLLSIFYNLYRYLPKGSNVRLLVGDAMQRFNRANDCLSSEPSTSEDVSDSSEEETHITAVTLNKSEDSSEEKNRLQKMMDLSSLINTTANDEYKNALEEGSEWIDSPLVQFGIHLLKTKGVECYVDRYSKWLPTPPDNGVKDQDQQNHLIQYKKHDEIIESLKNKDTSFNSSFSSAVMSFVKSEEKRKKTHFDHTIATTTAEKFVKEEYIAFSRYCEAMREQRDDDLTAKEKDIPIMRSLEKNYLSSAILYPFKDLQSNPHAYLVWKILQHHKLSDTSKYVRINHNKGIKWTLENCGGSQPENTNKATRKKSLSPTRQSTNPNGFMNQHPNKNSSNNSPSGSPPSKKLSLSDFIDDPDGLYGYAELRRKEAEAMKADLLLRRMENENNKVDDESKNKKNGSPKATHTPPKQTSGEIPSMPPQPGT